MSNSMNISLVGVNLLFADGHTERRTDMTKLIVAFRNFAKAPVSLLLSNILLSPAWL
jgi:prepilin-type processing-associated H-X9-DG protein